MVFISNTVIEQFINTFLKFSKFMSWSGAFDSLFCPGEMVFVHSGYSGGVFLPNLQ